MGHDPSWWGEFTGGTIYAVWYQTGAGQRRRWAGYHRREDAEREAERIGGWFPWVEVVREDR